MIKIKSLINYHDVCKDYFSILNNINWIDFGHQRQSGLQYKEGDDIWSSAVGKSKGEENSYDCINPIIQGTIFEHVINNYKLKRSRFMMLANKATYSMHRDNSPRIHIPILTNDQCFFIFKSGGVFNLRPGNIYEVDTTQEHTAINCSEQWRLHFVGVLS